MRLEVPEENHTAGTAFPMWIRSNKAENKTSTNTRAVKLVFTGFLKLQKLKL
jgi:hypothetical protein